MTRYSLVAFVCFGAFAQQTTRTGHSLTPVDDALFGSCSTIENIAREQDAGGAEQVFSIELYPKSMGSSVFPFPSEHSIGAVIGWLRAEMPVETPFAMFYSVNGRYVLNCRDTSGAVHEISSRLGNPLDLDIANMNAHILHFDFHNQKMAQVYIVAKAPLRAISGEEVLERVTRLLGARFVFLYIRNDPSFYGYSMDSSPYLFADRSKMLTADEYLRTDTMSCITKSGCHVGPSWH